MYLSVLVPVYNEADNLEPLAAEIVRALEDLKQPYEVILVDDGSKDGSFVVARDLARKDPRFKVVRLGRNFGQTAAIAAGIKHSTGEIVAMLDADLQNDPADIPKLLRKLDEGYDVVSGWRRDRQDPYVTRILPSNLANALISRVTGIALHDYGCTLKVYKRPLLENVRLLGEMHRFVAALVGFQGARVGELPVAHRARTRGVSKYGLKRTFKVVLDLFTVKFLEDFLAKPIYVFGGWGFALGGAGRPWRRSRCTASSTTACS